MSLATRCTSCETVFRVVQDQLKVSQGWVRCGRCDAVFNGLECLFDLDREGQPAAAESTRGAATALHAPGHDALDAESTWLASPLVGPAVAPAPAPAPGLDRDPDTIELTLDWAAPAPVPAPATASADALGLTRAFALATPAVGPDDTPAPAAVPAPTPLPVATPEFLRTAPHRSRWHAAPVRLALIALSAALLVGVAGQVLHHFRDLVAARWPQTLPLLTAWCKASGCVVAPLRRIDAVAVESTALTRTAEADTFTLAVGLRNRGALRVALPSLDVTLTDSDGHLVARRALVPSDFPATAPTLAGGAETLLNITLATGSPRVSGYTVEIFYP